MISVDNGAAEQLRSIGQYLIALADAATLEPPASDAAIPLPLGFEMHANGLSDARLHQLALSAYELRRQRDRFLPAELFAEPAWDILLDLFAARVAGKKVSVSSACIAAAVPETTGLRWVGFLGDLGLVAKRLDQLDKRRTWIELSDAGFKALRAYFETSVSTADRNVHRIELTARTSHV